MLCVPPRAERPRAQRLSGLAEDARAAESAGFRSFWVPQVPGYLDALTALSVVGTATRRIELGTAVVPIQTRHPLAMAQQAHMLGLRIAMTEAELNVRQRNPEQAARRLTAALAMIAEDDGSFDLSEARALQARLTRPGAPAFTVPRPA